MDEHNVPTEPGLYLAKSDINYEWWNLLVYIYGKPPYLAWSIWDYDNSEQPDYDIQHLYFGPRIAHEIDEGLVPIDSLPKPA